MTRTPAPWRRSIAVSAAALLFGVAACSSEEEACPADHSYAYDIAPAAASPYPCDEARDFTTAAIVTQVNAFWGSSAKYCRCDAGQLASGCESNALVLLDAPGHVFYDNAFLQWLTAFADGRDGAAAWVLAHEMGHNIQLRFSRAPTEPGADCLAGYFIQASVCQGARNRDDIEAAMSTACTVGDPTWFRGGSHGTCQQRITAVQIGMDAYKAGTDPLVACR